MRPGPKLKILSDFKLAKALVLIREEKIGLKAIAKELHTHRTVLYRNLRSYYGEYFDEMLEFYKSRVGFQKGHSSGQVTQFQKGTLRYINAKRWKPVGSIQYKKCRYGQGKKQFWMIKYIKIFNVPYGNNWVVYARWLWERKHGQIPKGRFLIHLDNNRENDDLENNLVLMTRKEHAQYRDARFPGRLELRKKRLARAARKRVRVLVRHREIWECTKCAAEYPTKVERCSKCGSFSLEQIKIKIKCA